MAKRPERIVVTSTDAKQGDPRSWTMVYVLKYSMLLAIVAGVGLYFFYFSEPPAQVPVTAPAPSSAPAPAPAPAPSSAPAP